jgi:hypothetical protein
MSKTSSGCRVKDSSDSFFSSLANKIMLVERDEVLGDSFCKNSCLKKRTYIFVFFPEMAEML